MLTNCYFHCTFNTSPSALQMVANFELNSTSQQSPGVPTASSASGQTRMHACLSLNEITICDSSATYHLLCSLSAVWLTNCGFGGHLSKLPLLGSSTGSTVQPDQSAKQLSCRWPWS